MKRLFWSIRKFWQMKVLKKKPYVRKKKRRISPIIGFALEDSVEQPDVTHTVVVQLSGFGGGIVKTTSEVSTLQGRGLVPGKKGMVKAR